jgi:hypothetical protein
MHVRPYPGPLPQERGRQSSKFKSQTSKNFQISSIKKLLARARSSRPVRAPGLQGRNKLGSLPNNQLRRFPLTPAFSLGERGRQNSKFKSQISKKFQSSSIKKLLARARSSRPVRAPGLQGRNKLGSLASNQLRRFPLTPALSLGERENGRQICAQTMMPVDGWQVAKSGVALRLPPHSKT